MIEKIKLCGKRPHAVTKQDHRASGMLKPDTASQRRHIVCQRCKTLRAEVTKRLRTKRRAAMATMIVGIDRIARSHQTSRESAIPASMLAHAVRNLHNGTRVLALPAIAGDRCAIGGGK